MSNAPSLNLNIQLTVAYDGTQYFGWQKTPTGPSIEETLQKVIEQIVQHPIVLQAASRTDAGVHARGQIVNFILHKEPVDLGKLGIGINSLLPKDIAVLDITEADSGFHPTLDCVGKEYAYRLFYGSVQMPEDRLYEWHYPYKLDVEKMREAAKLLIGNLDFTAFKNSKKNEHYKDCIREVREIKIDEYEPQKLKFTVIGTHFMYKMVRNIVGTLVYVGVGKLSLEQLPSILSGKDRTLAGITAPAHGLTLQKVTY